VDQTELAAAIREQLVWCERLGSPLYHALLARLADDLESSGVSWRVLGPHSGDPPRSLLPLRFLGLIHRLVLQSKLPKLAKYYPSAGGACDPAGAWNELHAAMEEDADLLSTNMPASVQTNEVTRCCALLPGFLEVARRTGLPLRLLEIGASAGLNLRWDKYRYETTNSAWGPGDSTVVFKGSFTGTPPSFDVPVNIVERRGCDLNPIDPTTSEGRLTLLSFVWADQAERFGQLANAIELARDIPVGVDRASALEWLEAQLAQPRPGVATVVFHSIVLLYFSREDREILSQLLARAGEKSTAQAPLAWLTMEPGEKETDVHLTIWPGGERTLIATAGFHGRNVELA
jgi:hypothetical protein